jgi:hypothetical protein
MQPTSASSDEHIAGGTRRKWGERRGGYSIVAVADTGDLRSKRRSLLPKITINLRNAGLARNPFDCAGSQGVLFDRWVRDRHHVGSSYRILRHHERRYLHRPRRRRLPVTVLTGVLIARGVAPPARAIVASPARRTDKTFNFRKTEMTRTGARPRRNTAASRARRAPISAYSRSAGFLDRVS